MISVENDHLGGSSCPAAGFYDACEGVVAFHEGYGSARLSAGGEMLLRRAERGQVRPCSGSVLEQHSFGHRELHYRSHVVLDRVDETCRALGTILNAHVEPDRAVEGGHLVEKNVSKLSLEYLSLVLV